MEGACGPFAAVDANEPFVRKKFYAGQISQVREPQTYVTLKNKDTRETMNKQSKLIAINEWLEVN